MFCGVRAVGAARNKTTATLEGQAAQALDAAVAFTERDTERPHATEQWLGWSWLIFQSFLSTGFPGNNRLPSLEAPR